MRTLVLIVLAYEFDLYPIGTLHYAHWSRHPNLDESFLGHIGRWTLPRPFLASTQKRGQRAFAARWSRNSASWRLRLLTSSAASIRAFAGVFFIQKDISTTRPGKSHSGCPTPTSSPHGASVGMELVGALHFFLQRVNLGHCARSPSSDGFQGPYCLLMLFYVSF